jgi:thioredoxin-dependent peroxiredoxin
LADEGQCRSRLESPRLHATLPVRGDGEPQRFSGSKARGPVLLSQRRTPGCTKEACAFRDDYEQFRKLDAEVVGISSDSVESHRSFAEKHGLPFTLLSDEGGKVRKLYGVSNTFGLFPGRVTYVIDEKGVIRHVFSSQLGTKRHVEEALRILPSIGYHNGPKGRLRSFHHWVSEL